ncbi:MAG: GAF domain-containing protein [Aristaeellaceae bacterium]
MHHTINWPAEKTALYATLSGQLSALVDGCAPVSALSNASALLWEALPQINWCGFYLLKDNALHLGPFQGKTACILIPVGRGVCGTAAAQRKLQLVPDVSLFPGHIACDSASRSEIVIPLLSGDTLLGVLDMDAPVINRFDAQDAAGLTEIARILTTDVDWTHGLL